MATQTAYIKMPDGSTQQIAGDPSTFAATASKLGGTLSDTAGIPKVAEPGANPLPGQQTNPANYSTPSTLTVPPPVSSGPISTSDLSKANSLPDASTLASATTTPSSSLSDMVTKVANTTLDSTGKAIDQLQAAREKQTQDAIAAEKNNVATISSRIDSLGQETPATTALNEARAKFNTDQTISDLQSINQKIVAAQEALQMGLIYEQDRPAREQLIVGRSASLQKQGLATIGALQATAQVLQGNLDLAKTYADATISAITTDNKSQMDALTTLLDLHNKNLVTLTADEKSLVDTRIQSITDQEKQIQDNKTAVTDLMTKYPTAFQKGGVTLLDTKETALKKMLPYLAAAEQAKLDTSTNKDGPAADKQQLLQLKSNGMPYAEAINAFGDTLSTSWIQSVYGIQTPGQVSPSDQLYSNVLNPDGTPKSGYKISIDSKGQPVITQDNSSGKSGWSWLNPLNWF